jgi:hypothetical protein
MQITVITHAKYGHISRELDKYYTYSYLNKKIIIIDEIQIVFL